MDIVGDFILNGFLEGYELLKGCFDKNFVSTCQSNKSRMLPKNLEKNLTNFVVEIYNALIVSRELIFSKYIH